MRIKPVPVHGSGSTPFRYAYAVDAQQRRGVAPPPLSIPLGVVPEAMQEMFFRAFTETGASGNRPKAKEWVSALDTVRGGLQTCRTSAMHVFPRHLKACPWCALESQGAVYFIDLGGTTIPTSSGFVLGRAWALIESVQAPPPLNVPSINTASLTARPLPEGIPGSGTIFFYRLLVVGIALFFAAAVPKAWFFALVGGFFGWAMAGSAGSTERSAERSRRKAVQQSAKEEFDRLVEQLRKECGPEGFHAKRQELAKLRDEYKSLPETEKQELARLHSTAHERQKVKFLERCFIDSADIPGVGPARKAALRSFGIETAADVTKHRVRQVRGFGDSLTRAVVDWKSSCERRFQFNPANAVSDADRNAVRARIVGRRVSIEASLNSGPAELQRFTQQAIAKASALRPRLDAATARLAQAEMDLSLV